MGESKLKQAKREEMLLSCSGVQTMGGRVQVRWETESAATPMTNTDYEILSLGQLYRDRADAENAFDELKNQ